MADEFDDEELFGMLKRAFVERDLESIAVDSNPRGNRMRYAAINYGLDHGWIYYGGEHDYEQSAVWTYYPTDAMLALKKMKG